MPCEPLHDLAQHFSNLCLEIPDMYEIGGSEVKQIIDDWKARTNTGKFAERRKGIIEVYKHLHQSHSCMCHHSTPITQVYVTPLSPNHTVVCDTTLPQSHRCMWHDSIPIIQLQVLILLLPSHNQLYIQLRNHRTIPYNDQVMTLLQTLIEMQR